MLLQTVCSVKTAHVCLIWKFQSPLLKLKAAKRVRVCSPPPSTASFSFMDNDSWTFKRTFFFPKEVNNCWGLQIWDFKGLRGQGRGSLQDSCCSELQSECPWTQIKLWLYTPWKIKDTSEPACSQIWSTADWKATFHLCEKTLVSNR